VTGLTGRNDPFDWLARKLKIAGKVLWDAAKKSLDVGRNPVNLLVSGGIKALMPKGLGQ